MWDLTKFLGENCMYRNLTKIFVAVGPKGGPVYIVMVQDVHTPMVYSALPLTIIQIRACIALGVMPWLVATVVTALAISLY
jgi:hypothetical protein